MTAIPSDYEPSAADFRGRVILVTGATGGVGRAVALALARAGAQLVLSGRSVPRLEQLYDELEALAPAAQPAMLPLNLMTATWAQYEAVAETLDREFGRLDGLLHAAAHFRSFARLEDIEPRDWLDTLQVNLTAPYTLTRLCLPLLRRSRDASVVFVSDEGGRKPKPFHGAYGLSKAAAETMSRSWALELENEARGESGLRFNTFKPAAMRTALRAKGYAGEVVRQLPGPGIAVAPLLWLLGPASRGRSGEAF